VVVQIQTLPPNERAQSLFFSERWISFSLSVKSVKTRTAFLPDLGSVLTNLRQKGGVLQRKNNNKNPSSSL